MRIPNIFRSLAPLILMVVVTTVSATKPIPRIAIVIDDMGMNPHAGKQVIELAGPIACAFLPERPYTASLAELAHAKGKEVLVHLPMHAMNHQPLGAGAIKITMNRQELREVVLRSLHSVPHAIGLNNHMGSLLTKHPGHMHWLMEAVHDDGGYFFLDSRTTKDTVAEQTAIDTGLPALRRRVFLDNDRSEAAIRDQFEKLVRFAHKEGFAIAIGHPYPETIRVLESLLSDVSSFGVELAPLSELLPRSSPEVQRWRAHLSP